MPHDTYFPLLATAFSLNDHYCMKALQSLVVIPLSRLKHHDSSEISAAKLLQYRLQPPMRFEEMSVAIPRYVGYQVHTACSRLACCLLARPDRMPIIVKVRLLVIWDLITTQIRLSESLCARPLGTNPAHVYLSALRRRKLPTIVASACLDDSRHREKV